MFYMHIHILCIYMYVYINSSNPHTRYVILTLAGTRFTTQTVMGEFDPDWDEKFELLVSDSNEEARPPHIYRCDPHMY